MKVRFVLSFYMCGLNLVYAQSHTPLKINHAEPLYVDLIRDLGARKGEREWNVGWGISSEKNYILYSGFMEYEFSPINRLGLEVEVPFSFYQSTIQENSLEEIPRHRMEGIKLASQYTFWVSSKYQLSMALGYMNELKFHSFSTILDRRAVLKGNTYSPLFIAAKRWGNQIHSLVYAGPLWEQAFGSPKLEMGMQVNFSMHYVLPSTSHFIGVEINHIYLGLNSETVIRPQMKVRVSNNLCIGMVSGIPIHLEYQRISFMLRVIYEPTKKSSKRK